jgi:hypothetical protein
MYKIFGSFEIFGNPSSFFLEIKKGFNSFLIVPFKELKEKRNLKIFGKKIASGTKSFAISIFIGIFNTIVSIVESISRYLDFFTFDPKFRYYRQKLRDVGINGILDGTIMGANALLYGRFLSFSYCRYRQKFLCHPSRLVCRKGTVQGNHPVSNLDHP